jgi:hypothetical protein
VSDVRPGLNPDRLERLMTAAVARCELDLAGFVVLTEAATGPYVVTPILAALAGADRVFAMTRPSRHGTVAEVAGQTFTLAGRVGVADRIRVITEKSPQVIEQADIVTNSGHLRPLDSDTVRCMKSSAVIPLMYEAWELRPGEVDLTACRAKGIRVAGTNERHPNVDVLSYLGVMAVKLLADAGVAVYRSRLVVLCDNPFARHLELGLKSAGAEVTSVAELSRALDGEAPDAILVALEPGSRTAISSAEVSRISQAWPGTVLAQLWGAIDRDAAAAHNLMCWPAVAPAPGHMGILPSAVGPEPVIRLQAGGLKVGEVLLRVAADRGAVGWEYVDAI